MSFDPGAHIERRDGSRRDPLRFDIKELLSRSVGRLRPSGRDHVVMDCFSCGKPAHLYVNTKTGAWDCKCCSIAGGPVQLVQGVLGVGPGEARRIIASESMPYIPHIKGELTERLEALRRERKQEVVDTPLPAEYTPCEQDGRLVVPRYLRQRGVQDAEIKAYGLGYCLSGRYASRVVFPVSCPLGRSFTTRATLPGMMPRYLGGDGVGHLLFGWEVALPFGPPWLIVEGPLDTLAGFRAGFGTLGLMGKSIRGSQLAMLLMLDGPKVMLLDPDAASYVVAESEKLDNVKIALYPNANQSDPAESPTTYIAELVSKAVPASQARVMLLKRRVSDLPRFT